MNCEFQYTFTTFLDRTHQLKIFGECPIPEIIDEGNFEGKG